MSHNPNPFDFVPFDENGPQLKSLEEWMSYGPLRTGRIAVEMKVLTPVHIVGEQPMSGNNIQESRFFKRGDKHYISASSIRGALRAFIEAACNGWVLQLTPYYQKEKKKQTYGFKVVDSETPKNAKISKFLSSSCSIDQRFCVPPSAEQGIDLASFLFGYIPGKPVDKNQFNPAWKGRIIIDDAEVSSSQLSPLYDANHYKVPDLNNQDAFMGGPHPSASSWWYQFPKEIRRDQYGVYKFIGLGFRGRKFYFHQDPVNCIKYYNESSDWNKNSDGKDKLYFFPIECIDQNESVSFDIFFDSIPEQLLYILFFALEPGKKIRHKLGYGKAYGYGSIEFSMREVVYQDKGFVEPEAADLNAIRMSIGKQLSLFDSKDTGSIAQFLHRASLDVLSFILWYESSFKAIFSYPCAGEGGFNVDLDKQKRKEYNGILKTVIENTLRLNGVKVSNGNPGDSISLDKGEKISSNPFLFRYKPTLHFEVYQANSTLDKKIKAKRKFSYL